MLNKNLPNYAEFLMVLPNVQLYITELVITGFSGYEIKLAHNINHLVTRIKDPFMVKVKHNNWSSGINKSSKTTIQIQGVKLEIYSEQTSTLFPWINLMDAYHGLQYV